MIIILMKTENRKILKEIKNQLIKTLGDNIKEAILFGSRARNQEDKYSDFDVLIILKNDYNWQYTRKIREICYDISLKYDTLIDSKIISMNELTNSPKGIHPLYTDAINEGIYA